MAGETVWPGRNTLSWREKVFGRDETLCRDARKCLAGTKHFVVTRESVWPGRNTLSWREKVFGRDETLCRDTIVRTAFSRNSIRRLNAGHQTRVCVAEPGWFYAQRLRNN